MCFCKFKTTTIYTKSKFVNFNEIFYQLNIGFCPPIFKVKDFKTAFRYIVTMTVAELQRPSWISLPFHTKILYFLQSCITHQLLFIEVGNFCNRLPLLKTVSKNIFCDDLDSDLETIMCSSFFCSEIRVSRKKKNNNKN